MIEFFTDRVVFMGLLDVLFLFGFSGASVFRAGSIC